jgi:DNA repair protein RadC
MKKDKKTLSVSDAGKNKPGTGKNRKNNAKYNSYFDGLKYKGFLVKTLLIREHEEKYNPLILQDCRCVHKMFKPLEKLDHERFYTVVIDGKNRVIAVHLTSQGILNQALVHPREVFKPALLCSGAGVILVHNHPSGEPLPSNEDFILTQRLVEAGKLLGIEVLDHVIIGYDTFYSFSKNKTLKNP